MNRLLAVIMAGIFVFASGMTGTAYAFDELEDLSRSGNLGNKGAIEQPVNEWENVTIMGPATATQEQMVAYIKLHNPNPQLKCSIEEIVNFYYEEAGAEGVRPDVALCQALKETGFFNYGNDVLPQQNNYCGLGATGNKVRGYYFASPQRGVRAHIQHLMAYATEQEPSQPLVDPRYDILVTRYPQYHGTVQYWIGLNGRWAVPGVHYGQDILTLWHEALNM